MTAQGGAMRAGMTETGDEQRFGSVYNPRVVARFVPYAMPFKGLVAGATAAMLVFTATQVAVPWMIKIGIDDHIASGNFAGLTWIVALFVANAVLNWGARLAEEVFLARAGQGVLYGLRREMFAHLQRMSLRFFDQTEVGRIMSRVQGDVYQLQEFIHVAVATLGDLLGLAGIVAALLLLNVKLGLISMAVLPLLILTVAVWQPFAIRSFIRVRQAISSVNGALNENVSGVRVVQSMNRQDSNLRKFDELNQDTVTSNLYAARLSNSLIPPVDILTALAIGLVLLFGSRMVSSASLSSERWWPSSCTFSGSSTRSAT